MGEKTIVSVAYECTIIINNNNNIIDSIRGSENRFKWHLLNGHKSARIRNSHRKEETHNLSKISRFLFKSFHIRRLQKQLFFSPIQILIFWTLRNSADGHISSSLGNLWLARLRFWLGFRDKSFYKDDFDYIKRVSVSRSCQHFSYSSFKRRRPCKRVYFTPDWNFTPGITNRLKISGSETMAT